MVAGFILSLGLLVDDSIVVVENISRHLRMGKSRAQAAIDATGEIGPAVIGSTGVLVFAFLPMFFLPGGAGQFVKSFIGTIIATVDRVDDNLADYHSLSRQPHIETRRRPRGQQRCSNG